MTRKKQVVAEYKNLAAFPGTKWVSFGDMDSNGKVVACLVDAFDGHVIDEKELQEIIRVYNSEADIDVLKTDLITMRTTVNTEIEKAKKTAKKRYDELIEDLKAEDLSEDQFKEREKKCGEEIDQFFNEYWSMHVEPKIERAEVLRNKLLEFIDDYDGADLQDLVRLTERMTVKKE